MLSGREFAFFDALYGDVELCPKIADLVSQPLVQRLRQVRLSNIDSISMPGISSITRYEHALGTAHLADRVGVQLSLPENEHILLQAAALIHDTAITPFGHLAEEALKYLDSDFNHEEKWSLLLAGSDTTDIGGSNLQLFLGHKGRLQEWALRTFGTVEILREVVDTITGRGKFGRLIVGEIDLDNLDNVSRIAHHMGLEGRRDLPERIAACIVGMTSDGIPVFADQTVQLVEEWLECRRAVYGRLMLSEVDFTGKVMLLYASVNAFERNYLSQQDWKMYDSEFLSRLISPTVDKDISETVKRWLLGDLWDIGPLLWMEGSLPGYSMVHRYSAILSEELGKTCFAYRIKDKRNRLLKLRLESRHEVPIGEEPKRWLLGFGSPKKLSIQDIRAASELASRFFKLEHLPLPHSATPTLFHAV
jgi:uncharacterized protein